MIRLTALSFANAIDRMKAMGNSLGGSEGYLSLNSALSDETQKSKNTRTYRLGGCQRQQLRLQPFRITYIDEILFKNCGKGEDLLRKEVRFINGICLTGRRSILGVTK